MRLTLTLLLLASSCLAQDAKVLPLSPIDAEQAQVKYQALQQAQKEWDSFQERIKQDYLVVPKGDPEAGNTVISSSFTGFTATSIMCGSGIITINNDHQAVLDDASMAKCEAEQKARDEKQEREHPSMYERAGWENGFTFTRDFKFLVPKTPTPQLKYNYNNPYNLGVQAW